MTAPVVDHLAGFAQALRAAGLPIGTGDAITFVEAVGRLDVTEPMDVYWAGRTTLVRRPEDLATYHGLFERFWLDRSPAVEGEELFGPGQRDDARQGLNVAETHRLPPNEALEGTASEHGTEASEDGALARTSFASASPEELRSIARLLRSLRLQPPRRRSRRWRSGTRRGQLDLRRTVRELQRTGGEPRELFWRAPRERRRKLVLVLDISGSMQQVSRSLLHFAFSALRASRDTEVFVFGTRLTRLTGSLRVRSIDDALARAADEVVDFAGGTRIGDSLDAFVREWGRRGLARGAVVVVCSDGLDRGRTADLVAATQRLARQCHRLVWLSPLPTWAPSAGLDALTPYVDAVLPGRTVVDLERFAAGLGELERGGRRARTAASARPAAEVEGVSAVRPVRSSPREAGGYER